MFQALGKVGTFYSRKLAPTVQSNAYTTCFFLLASNLRQRLKVASVDPIDRFFSRYFAISYYFLRKKKWFEHRIIKNRETSFSLILVECCEIECFSNFPPGTVTRYRSRCHRKRIEEEIQEIYSKILEWNRPTGDVCLSVAVFHFCRSLLFGLESLRLRPSYASNRLARAEFNVHTYVRERCSFARIYQDFRRKLKFLSRNKFPFREPLPSRV